MMICPQCHRRTIERVGGEWCPFCRGFVAEVKLRTDEAPLIRVIVAAKNR